MSSGVYIGFCSADGCTAEAVMDENQDGELEMPEGWSFEFHRGASAGLFCPVHASHQSQGVANEEGNDG